MNEKEMIERYNNSTPTEVEAGESLLPALLKHFEDDESIKREIQTVYSDLLERAEAICERQKADQMCGQRFLDTGSPFEDESR